MVRKLLFGLICVLILVLPAYSGDDTSSCKKDGCDKSGCAAVKSADKQCEKGECPHKQKCEKCTCKGKKCDGKCENCTCPGKSTKVKGKTMGKTGMAVGVSQTGEMPCKVVKVEIKRMLPANPLDRTARRFIESNKVKHIAVLPFSDYSMTSSIESKSGETWASRRIHDYMTAEFLEIGKLVVPYDTMTQAVADVKKIKRQGATGMELLGQQMTGMKISPQFQTEVFKEIGRTMPVGTQSVGMSFSADEIKALGQKLGVQAIFTGAISDYGTRKYIKADARTFIPPFLGLWNPSQQALCRMIIYLYNTETGELIWSSLEEVKREPTFPIFSNEAMNYDYINRKLAEQVVNHFRDVFVMEKAPEERVPSTGGPGTTRRERDARIIVRQK